MSLKQCSGSPWITPYTQANQTIMLKQASGGSAEQTIESICKWPLKLHSVVLRDLSGVWAILKQGLKWFRPNPLLSSCMINPYFLADWYLIFGLCQLYYLLSLYLFFRLLFIYIQADIDIYLFVCLSLHTRADNHITNSFLFAWSPSQCLRPYFFLLHSHLYLYWWSPMAKIKWKKLGLTITQIIILPFRNQI